MRIVLALLLLTLAPAALADYKSDYREGIAAAERQDWAKVDALMRRAIAAEPNPQPRIRLYGQVFVPYVPQFYLGLSAFSRNDCSAAVSLLEDARNVGAIRGQRLEERQQIMLRACRARLAGAAPAQAPVTPAAPTAATPVPAPARATTAPPVAAAKPAPPAAPSAPAAAPAGPAFDAAKAQALVTRLDRLDGALAAATAKLGDPALAAVRDNWQRQSDPLLAQAQQLRMRQRGAQQARDGAALAAVERELAQAETRAQQLAGGIDDAMRRAADAAQARVALAGQVRARLRPLADAYFAGDFARAAGWDEESTLQAVPQARAEALLLRAAARFELYVLGGERDLDQFERIRDDVRAARRLSTALNPSAQAFSPRFRALFASTR